MLQATSVPTRSVDERLAEPTLPASPSQADLGAQVFWLHCLPCHGERGQGLTEEFRQTYPPEDRQCWNSGCHGKHPYDGGFSLPTKIPALVGKLSLQKFPSAAILHAYISAAMPFWKPRSLTDDEYWQVTAFLLRENGLWDSGAELGASNADQVQVGPPPPTATPEPFLGLTPGTDPAGRTYVLLLIGLLLIIMLLLFVMLRRRRSV